MGQPFGGQPAPGPAPDAVRRGQCLERFQPTAGRWAGWAAVGVAGLLALDVVRDGVTHADVAGLAVLAAVATLVYMAMVRPRVAAYENVLLVKNMATDTEVPWSRVDSVTRRQTLRIKTDQGTISCVASTQSATSVMRSGRQEVEIVNGLPYQEYVVLKAGSYVSQRGPEVPSGAPIVRRWAWAELAVLASSAVVLVVVWLT